MKKILLHLSLILCYSLVFMQCYNLIATHLWWPYKSLSQGMEYLSMNVVAIAIAYVSNYWVVFKGISVRPLPCLPRFGRKDNDRQPAIITGAGTDNRLKGKTLVQKVLVDLAMSFLLLVVVNIPYLYLMSYLATQSSYIDWVGASFYNIICLMGMEMVFYIREYTRQIMATNAAKEMLLQYQYDALRAQINPHFLFNSLNIIQALTYENPMQATRAIQCLSNIYRYVLDHANKKNVPLTAEWENAQTYIELLKCRYESNLDIAVSGTPNVEASMVPMTMQILIENIFKHNVVSKKKPMLVDIQFHPKSMSIGNTVQLKANTKSTGFGLHYLKDLYMGQGHTLEVTDDGKEFLVRVPYIFNPI